MFKNKSKVLFIFCILSTIYVFFLTYEFVLSSGIQNCYGENNEIINFGCAISIAVIQVLIPHIILIALGAIISWIGFFIKKSWISLVGTIFYCIGALYLLLLNGLRFLALISIPLIILGFIGYSNQKKLNISKKQRYC